MNVLMIAFGHPDNVLSLCKNISSKIDISLVFVMSGTRFQQGILNINISGLKYGLNTKEDSVKTLPKEIQSYIGSNFNLRIIKTQNRKILRDKYFKNLFSIIKASWLLKKENYDLVHFNGVSGFMFYFLLVFRRIKKIWTLHDFLSHSGEENKKSFLVQKILAKFNFHFIQHYKYLQTQLIKKYKLLENKVDQVYSGNLDVFNAFQPRPINLAEKYILFFGRISKYKGIDVLIESFSYLYNIDKVKLIIAGKGDLWFDDAIFSNNKDIILINRYIETEELVYLIKNCLFVVIPYSDATHSATIVTAFTFYKPVIATNVGGLNEVVLDGITGKLVPPKDPQAFANAIQELLNSPETLTQMSINIKNTFSKGEYSWENIAHKMAKVYKNILNE